jgi:hypothetical protein
MALNGILEELAVLDVVQFMSQAHLSGVLVIKCGAEEANLFYRRGGLVHAQLGPESGLEVLVRIVDWTYGTFFFQPGESTPEETIRMDLHRAVMCALKIRDERKLEEEKRKAAPPRPPTPRELLARAIESFDFVSEAAIFEGSGVLAAAGRKGATGDSLATMCPVLLAFHSNYPRGRFRRAILDDERGTVLVSGLQRNRWLVVAAERGVALGAVTVGMGRLVAKVETLETPSREAVAETV